MNTSAHRRAARRYHAKAEGRRRQRRGQRIFIPAVEEESMRVMKHVEDHIQFDTYRSWNSFMPVLIRFWHQMGFHRLGEIIPVTVHQRVWSWLPWPTVTYVKYVRTSDVDPRAHKALDRLFDKNLDRLDIRQLFPRQLRASYSQAEEEVQP